jgi:hypothetical protein
LKGKEAYKNKLQADRNETEIRKNTLAKYEDLK